MWEKEQVIDEFQKRGKRITQQRRMLLDVILEGRWTSCKDIYYDLYLVSYNSSTEVPELKGYLL